MLVYLYIAFVLNAGQIILEFKMYATSRCIVSVLSLLFPVCHFEFVLAVVVSVYIGAAKKICL